RVRLRIIFGQSAGQSGKFRVHLIDTHAGLEPAHDGGAQTRRIAARPDRKLIIEWHPKLLVYGKLKSSRHHADNGGGLAIDPDCLADDFRIAVEIPLPDFVRK